jgi:hypothetical protein
MIKITYLLEGIKERLLDSHSLFSNGVFLRKGGMMHELRT